jgi:hypothetical protein
MAQTGRSLARILVKDPVKTVADRRARRHVPTVPPQEAGFSELERTVFQSLERRVIRSR